jgi:exopolyphosphatase/guanosine-5'-triphosphate,3'-diphosphate pyrophosphatase
VGGTITTLAAMELQLQRYDSQRVQAYPLRQEAVTHWRTWLATLPLSERRAIVGLPPQRADIMLAGVVILEQFMKALSVPVLYVSDRDNLEGYLLLRMREEGWLTFD